MVRPSVDDVHGDVAIEKIFRVDNQCEVRLSRKEAHRQGVMSRVHDESRTVVVRRRDEDVDGGSRAARIGEERGEGQENLDPLADS